MSGDVQPRRRKDKKRKRDDRKSDGEVNLSRQQSFQDDDESSHGVQSTHMGIDDQHIHVHHEQHTGGHWCAKLLFFILMAVMLGLVGMIILETRGLSDLDTPLSESRYSNYLHGWVEEHREEHDDHDKAPVSVGEHDVPDEHDETPFEEEEDHSEVDEEEEEEEQHENEGEEEKEGADKEIDDDNNNEDDHLMGEDIDINEDEDLDDEEDDEEDEDDNDDIEEENAGDDVADEDEDEDEENEIEDDHKIDDDYDDDDNEDPINVSKEIADDDDDSDDEDDNDELIKKAEDNTEANPKIHSTNDDEDDDGFDSFEEEDEATEAFYLENDAEEILILKAKENANRLAKENEEGDEEEIVNEEESNKKPDKPTSYLNKQIKEKPVDGGPLAQDEEGYSYFRHDKDRRPPDIFDDIVYENEMKRANDELLSQHHGRALITYAELSKRFPDRAEPFLGQAKIYEHLAKKLNKSQFVEKSINAYKRYLAFDELIRNDKEFRKSAETCIELMRSLGHFNSALHTHHMLVNRFPNDPDQRNNLAITLLMMERYSDAKVWLERSLNERPHNGFTLTLFGYILKMHDSDYAQAANYLQRGLDSQAKEAQDARFYLALGESYERLGLTTNASAVYKRGAQLKLFPSQHQRSVYNQPNLRAKPIWSLTETTHELYFRMISDHWRTIRDEALHILAKGGGSGGGGNSEDYDNEVYFRSETENLLATGNWKEFLLFSRGERHIRNCQHTPVTCWLIEQFKSAATCRRGQVKFSIMQPGTHVWSHCGPTNSRLRAHLGLVVPHKTRMRVVNETINWTEGEFIVFDDSFEHEVWHEGEKLRLILIVDFWHPDLTEQQISMLTKI